MLVHGRITDPNYGKEQQVLFNTVCRFFNIDTGDRLDELLERLRLLGACVAGGSVTSCFSNSPLADLDIYLRELNESSIESFESLMADYDFTPAFSTKLAHSYTRQSGRSRRVYHIQLIQAFCGPPQEVFDTFDFTICAGSFDFTTGLFDLHPRFLPDIAKRRLVYMGGSRYPICALYRTIKYTKKGYTIPGSTMMHLALSCARLDIRTFDELKAQLMGIDTLFMGDYLKRLPDDVPLELGEFLADIFESIDGSLTVAETEEDSDLELTKP